MSNIIDKLIERYNNKVVNILGSEYTIKFRSHNDDDELKECAAYCSYHEHIIILDYESKNYIGKSDLYIINCIKRALRHEIIHTFLDESGLFCNANTFKGPWPVNEEMIDWFALQMPKIFKVFAELDLITHHQEKILSEKIKEEDKKYRERNKKENKKCRQKKLENSQMDMKKDK